MFNNEKAFVVLQLLSYGNGFQIYENMTEGGFEVRQARGDGWEKSYYKKNELANLIHNELLQVRIDFIELGFNAKLIDVLKEEGYGFRIEKDTLGNHCVRKVLFKVKGETK